METPAITIKFKGASALRVVNGKSLASAAKLKGAGLVLAPAGVAKAASPAVVEIEGAGVLGGGGAAVGATEFEANGVGVAAGKGPAARAVSGNLSAAKGTAAKPAAAKLAVGKAVGAHTAGAGAATTAAKVPVFKAAATGKSAGLAAGKLSTGTIWSGTGLSLGLGLGLGAAGPVLLLGALGLTATGIYLYRRNRQVEFEPDGGDDTGGLDAMFVEPVD